MSIKGPVTVFYFMYLHHPLSKSKKKDQKITTNIKESKQNINLFEVQLIFPEPVCISTKLL
jgi:arginine utilization protein RocB